MKGDKIYKKALKIAKENNCDLSMVYGLLVKSFEMGNYNAAYAIGTWYLFGKYVKKSYAKAIPYLEYASEGGITDAHNDLAVCYENGKGVKKDKHKAFLLFLKAFFGGDKKAAYEIGRHYYYGYSVSKNIEIAELWLSYSEK